MDILQSNNTVHLNKVMWNLPSLKVSIIAFLQYNKSKLKFINYYSISKTEKGKKKHKVLSTYLQ